MLSTATYTVYRIHINDQAPTWAFLSKTEAETELRRLQERRANTVYRLTEETVTTDFRPPSKDQPRDLYTQERQEFHKPGTAQDTWNIQDVKIVRAPGTVAASYRRNYPGVPPFEPFRQFNMEGEHHCALISPDYQGTSVIDLETGKIIAAEDIRDPLYGFCPAGFYVPDWRELHGDNWFPGCAYWDERWDRWPDGTLGFVWGCYWGDDYGWKVQVLDLSRIREGIVTRDERFGYQHIAVPPGVDPGRLIEVTPGEGDHGPTAEIMVPHVFDLASGKKLDHYHGA